jgi:dTMP kinase
LEAEGLAFHRRVRQAFLALAERDPGRYLVIDAAAPADEVERFIVARVGPLLDAQAATGSQA